MNASTKPGKPSTHRISRSLCLVAGLAAAQALAVGRPATAATWHVARDGSQLFTYIQDALNFSAPGDTVLLQAGRYDFGGPNRRAGLAHIDHDQVVLRGVDRDAVILGPASGSPEAGIGGGASTGTGTIGVVIENMTIENLNVGVSPGGAVTLRHLTLRGCRAGVSVEWVDGVLVQECLFSQNTDGILVVVNSGLRVVGCTLTGPGVAVSLGAYVSDVVVDRCTIEGFRIGVQLTRATSVQVLDSAFQGCDRGVELNAGSTALLRRNHIRDGQISVAVQSESHVQGDHNSLLAGSHATLWFQDRSTAQLDNNHIPLQAPRTVWLESYATAPMGRLDLRNNFWNTQAPDAIAARIWDGNDDAALQGFVEFLPIAETPVPAPTVSFGELKAGFADR